MPVFHGGQGEILVSQFTAQIVAFAEDAKRKMELVVKQSAQDVGDIAQTPVAKGGNMPVDTGFLRNSLVAGLNGSTSLSGPDSYTLAIAGAELGDSIFFGWTANYARFVEYGTQGRAGRFFMLNAAQQWKAIVARNAEKARAL